MFSVILDIFLVKMEAVTFPLPYWEHGQSHFETVYEPAEDTFILIDALEKDYMELKQSK